MASVNAWADGMSAFKDAYGLVRGFQKTNRTKKIMDDEKFMAEGGAGYGLTGSALEKARYRALGDLETEFGNAEGGLANRRMVQQIEQGDRDNRINEANEAYRTRLEGEIAEQTALLKNLNIKADTGLKGSQSYAARGQGKLSFGRANEISKLLPGKVEQQKATLNYTNAGTDNRKENTNLTREQITQIQKMSDAKLAELVSNTALTDENVARIKALTQPEVDNLVARTDQTKQMTTSERLMMPLRLAGTVQTNLGLSLGNQETAATLDSTVAATNAENALGTNTDQAALASQTAEQKIMAEAAGMEFDTLQAGNDWVISQIEGSGDIGPERKLALVQTLQKHGVTKIAGMSAEIKSAAELAIQAGGLEGLVDYYDTIDDGGSLQVVENSDGTVRVLKNDDFGQTVLMEGPREVVQGQLTAQLTNPSTAMEVAAAALDMQATKATIGLTKNQALVSAVRKDAVKASTDLANAQVDKIKQEIETAKAGLGAKDEIAYKGYASLMESEAYMYMLEENPEAAENARKTYLEAFGLLTSKTSGGGDGPVGDGEGLAGGGDGIGERPSELHSDYPWDKNMASLWANMSPGSRAAFSKPETPTRVDPKADKSGGLATNVVPPSQTGEPWNAAKAPAGFPQSEWDASDATKRKRILKTLKARAAQADN